MLQQRVNKIVNSLKLTKPDQDELNRLLKRPEIQAVLNADEKEGLEHRKKLINELAAIPETVAKIRSENDKAARLAVERFEKAEADYKTALEALRVAQLAFHYSQRLPGICKSQER